MHIIVDENIYEMYCINVKMVWKLVQKTDWSICWVQLTDYPANIKLNFAMSV